MKGYCPICGTGAQYVNGYKDGKKAVVLAAHGTDCPTITVEENVNWPVGQ